MFKVPDEQVREMLEQAVYQQLFLGKDRIMGRMPKNTMAFKDVGRILKKFITDIKGFNKKVVKRNQIFENFAKEHSILFVNLYTLGEKSTDFYTNDGIHFNEKGVREEARLVTEKIKEYIN